MAVRFTAEELAEMARADAEIEAEFRLTQEDLKRSRILDRANLPEWCGEEIGTMAELERMVAV